jgi:serine/threonine protein kinase/tetratricopeptide (TPR) repeat protein
MNSQQEIRPSTDGRLVEALDQYLAALQTGVEPDKEAFFARYPDLAEDLAQCLASLEFIRQAAVKSVSPVEAETAGEGSHAIGALGDFRLLREVGRGGMGVVYEAEQISLNRRVALKVLPFASTLDSRQLQRFKNEAQAAACLHHTNIVPVFATGVERGVHYYAMQFIEGHTLAEVIAGLKEGAISNQQSAISGDKLTAERSPLNATCSTAVAALSTLRSTKPAEFFRQVAELGIQAAEALEYAHEMGILHRDIKPANLMLESSPLAPQGRGAVGEGLRLWITDFGLAQIQNETTRLTMTGDLLGTLRYMSPEQALAKRVIVDHRTDIYSLGVTLYELLTLEPAFHGKDRQELLRQIALEEPKPLRRINGAISAEIETVVLKMMERDPNGRYPTAKEAADDLRRFVLHEPVRARRPSLFQRARKWSRRHPSVVASAVVGLFLAIVGLAISNWLIARERDAKERALEDKAAALKEARQESQRAGIEAATAKQLADVLLGVFQASDPVESGVLRHADDAGKQVPASELLDRAAQRIETGFTGPALTKAAMLDAVGNVYRNLGIYDKAQRLLESAYAIRSEQLPPNHPDLATSLLHLGQLHQHLANWDKAEQLLYRALAIRQEHWGAGHLAVAEAKYHLAWFSHDVRNYPFAEQLLRDVVTIRAKELGAKHPQTAQARALLALVLIHMNKLEESLQVSAAEFDAPDLVKATLAYKRAVDNRYRLRDYVESEYAYREVLAILRRNLSDRHPAFILILGDLAGMLRTKGDLPGAEAAARESITLGNKVIPSHPLIIELRRELAKLLLARGVFEESEVHLLDNLHVLRKAGPKKNSEVKTTLELLVRLYAASNQPEKAAEHRAALEELRKLEANEK